jgi:hypothetical protein
MIQDNVILYRKEYFVHMTKIATGLYKNLPSEGLLLALYICPPRQKKKQRNERTPTYIYIITHIYSTSSRVSPSFSS